MLPTDPITPLQPKRPTTNATGTQPTPLTSRISGLSLKVGGGKGGGGKGGGGTEASKTQEAAETKASESDQDSSTLVNRRLTLERPSSLPISANSISVAAPAEGKKENPFNHFKEGDPWWQPCRHWRVLGWALGQCADCKEDLGPERLQQETEAAERGRLDEVKRSSKLHSRTWSQRPLAPHLYVRPQLLAVADVEGRPRHYHPRYSWHSVPVH
jgi:hypothetical protein